MVLFFFFLDTLIIECKSSKTDSYEPLGCLKLIYLKLEFLF